MSRKRPPSQLDFVRALLLLTNVRLEARPTAFGKLLAQQLAEEPEWEEPEPPAK